MRRLCTLLITVLVAAGGVALASCPRGPCAAMPAAMAAPARAGMQHGMHQMEATSHDCCDRDGIARPYCCPEAEQLSQRAAASSPERASHGFQLAAAQPVPTSLAAVATTAAAAPRRVPRGAPPGTLISLHTSLLV